MHSPINMFVVKPATRFIRCRMARKHGSVYLRANRLKFTEVYPGFIGSNVYLNMDIGLIDIQDRTAWKTEIFNIGELHELVALNSNALTLRLVGQKVIGYGCASQKMEGTIDALFYRYFSCSCCPI